MVVVSLSPIGGLSRKERIESLCLSLSSQRPRGNASQDSDARRAFVCASTCRGCFVVGDAQPGRTRDPLMRDGEERGGGGRRRGTRKTTQRYTRNNGGFRLERACTLLESACTLRRRRRERCREREKPKSSRSSGKSAALSLALSLALCARARARSHSRATDSGGGARIFPAIDGDQHHGQESSGDNTRFSSRARCTRALRRHLIHLYNMYAFYLPGLKIEKRIDKRQ